MILGNEVGIYFDGTNDIAFDVDHDTEENPDIPTIQQYSVWNWTFPVYQWGYYDGYEYTSRSIQSSLDTELRESSLSELDLPWDVAQVSIVGMERETFTYLTPELVLPEDQLPKNYDSSSTEVLVIQCIGILMMVWNTIIVFGLTHYSRQYVEKTKQQMKDNGVGSGSGGNNDVSSSGHNHQSHHRGSSSGLQTALGVDRMLFSTRELVIPASTTMTSSSIVGGSASASSSSSRHSIGSSSNTSNDLLQKLHEHQQYQHL